MSLAVSSRSIAVTLPDGAVRTFETPVTPRDIAQDISKSLAKDAYVAEVDGALVDLDQPLERDVSIRFIRGRDPEALAVIRHDAAHVMAEAVQDLFPGTQVTIGPPIDDGFYYDFARNEPFSTDDLEKIEQRMSEIVAADKPFARKEVGRDEARALFERMGERYKLELLDAIPEDQPVSLYYQGDWVDLCRGPHGPSTGRVGPFKLLKVAGAYWRGDSKNEQLQRIYGTAYPTEKDLKAHLTRLEEAEKRDHRRLGRELDLFHIQEEATGSIFWHPKGWTVFREIESYIRRRLDAAGYDEVKTPQLIDRSLWEKSGHWEKFHDHMFTLESEERTLAIKPMNCPGHVQIFNRHLYSYRDLPLRMAEFGSCFRNEPSGALHGIMRTRNFTQDDAHIFCTPEQIDAETQAFCTLLASVYTDLGFPDFRVKFSDRPPVRAGADEVWDQAEQALMDATRKAGVDVTLNPGEGAFYGPKLEFVLTDALGRDWQCGTLQVDFVLPERLDASYVGADNERHRPVMLHRAILGSLERFIGILIEETAGRLPMWLAPLQVVVATITNDADDYAREVVRDLREAGLRVEADTRSEKIGYKVREHSVQKVPVILAVGAREQTERAVAMRRLGEKTQQSLALADAVTLLKESARPPA
jgi:threonyl-tRNA synthetase